MTTKEAKKLGFTFEHAMTWRDGQQVWGIWLISSLGSRDQYIERPASLTKKEREQQVVEAYNEKMAAYAQLLGVNGRATPHS